MYVIWPTRRTQPGQSSVGRRNEHPR